ncbi:SDR family NAD(P)-dependent oxidoreductase [Solwaraspora sp. WMMD937]|uniref:SDR family NAD(P)-dependent oxidoreductase n=1 Tax=Solwaraspora sp. WMMD937 TaxID=3016090 RepID=UPI00249C0FA1|nr:SDR family oxidoreductase [Solwaraspora sp. WMMD937]WFE20427.1 SDR family NAD(P)-dependent oxidoreductase [Solwaraspora sp. WMMD937]
MSRTIVVTGARRGIGAALATGLAAPGTTLVLHHLAAADEAEAVAARCRAAGAHTRIVEADLSVATEVLALAEAAGPVDVLVNNAARASNVWIDELPLAEWEATFAVNVTAPMLLSQALAAGMRDRGGGRIINVTSATVRLGGPSGPSYVSSKAALVGLTRSLARAFGPDGTTARRSTRSRRARSVLRANGNSPATPRSTRPQSTPRSCTGRRCSADSTPTTSSPPSASSPAPTPVRSPAR